MKIGVITHWWCFENYGQVLQGWAFQKFLEGRGHEAFIIKYYPGSAFSDKITLRRVFVKLFSPRLLIKSIEAIMKGSRRSHENRKSRISALRDFDEFRSKHMKFTKNIYRSYNELIKSDEIDADMYSAGSDVVWKLLPFNNDGKVMFLDFGRKGAKRISYSASFGDADVSCEYARFAAPLINKMDAVSVREPSGVDICVRLGRKDAVCVMDPVFLFNGEYYRKIFNVPEKRFGVYGYFLNMKPKVPVDEIDKVAKDRNQGVAKFVTVYNDMDLPESRLINPTLPEWIRMIGSADLFVTNSFHGASMAIILHTPFVVMLKSNGNGMDNRLLGLLGRLGLQDRIYDAISNGVTNIAERTVDWHRVDSNLKKELAASLNYLKEKCGV